MAKKMTYGELAADLGLEAAIPVRCKLDRSGNVIHCTNIRKNTLVTPKKGEVILVAHTKKRASTSAAAVAAGRKLGSTYGGKKNPAGSRSHAKAQRRQDVLHTGMGKAKSSSASRKAAGRKLANNPSAKVQQSKMKTCAPRCKGSKDYRGCMAGCLSKKG